MVKWDIQHTAIMVAVTLLSATAGYLEQQSATTIMGALQSWAAAKHMVYMVAVFDLTALVTLAKQSFLTPPGNAGNGGGPPAEQKALPSSFPKKPAAMRTALAAAACLLLSECSWLRSPQGGGTVATIADITVCILNHSREPIAQIAKDCGPQATEDVITKILDAHHANAIRESCGK